MPAVGDLSIRYGPVAIVTGASSGIGQAFAERLARDGISLVLVGRDAVRLREVGAGIRRASPAVAVEEMRLDLADAAQVAELAQLARTGEVGLLVHAAGEQRLGRFLDIPVDAHLHALELHCRSTLELVHAFARPMLERRRGGIVLLSSSSALLRNPLVANYAATKAYILTLAEALWEELRHGNVDVLGLAPGMTDTPALRLQRPTGLSMRFTSTAEAVVEGALASLGRRPVHVTSAADRVVAQVCGRLLPRSWSLPLARRLIELFFPHLQEGLAREGGPPLLR